MSSKDSFGGDMTGSGMAGEPVSQNFSLGVPANPSAASTTDRFVPTQPKSLEDASLDENVVAALILKFLYSRGNYNGRTIAQQIKLPFSIVEQQLFSLKNKILIGYSGASVGGDYKYELSPKGMEQARALSEHCTYCGAAPVGLPSYIDSVNRQSLRNLNADFRSVANALSDLVIDDSVISQVGQAIKAAKALFLFGAPGNGKTSIARRIVRAVDESIWIPRTLSVGGEIVRLFDPSLHEEDPLPTTDSLLQDHEIDERWVRIKRPTVVVGGELSMKHLEAHLNPVTGIIESPIHLKSNCGCLVVDDFGRQRISTTELLNRWIIPLEAGHDYLNLPSGRQLKVPFEQLVVFSTNLKPSGLCDEAFLRRIPYKVQVLDPTEAQYRELFQRRLQEHGIAGDLTWINYLIENYYRKESRPMRFCHVDDLVSRVREFCEFHGEPLTLNRELIEIAANNYFNII